MVDCSKIIKAGIFVGIAGPNNRGGWVLNHQPVPQDPRRSGSAKHKAKVLGNDLLKGNGGLENVFPFSRGDF